MDLLIQLASPIITAVMAVVGAYVAFNNRLTKLETKADAPQRAQKDSEQIAEVKNQLSELKIEIAVINTEIKSLTDETRKHNNVVERMFRVETRVDAIEARI